MHTAAVNLDSASRAAPIIDGVRRALADAWALIAPVDCAGCGAADRALCPSCALGLRPRPLLGQLDLVTPSSAPFVGGAVPGAVVCVPIVAALPYQGPAPRVLLALKEQGRTELARPLAPLLDLAIDRVWCDGGAELIVPVPGSWAARGTRGFEPVALIARRAGLVVTPALRALRPSAALDFAPQKSRTLAARLGSDAARWRVSSRVRGRRVVLVDDVVTSGATLRAATLALRAAGAEVAGCAAIAATLRRVGASSIPWRFIRTDDQGPHDNDREEDYREGKEA